MDRSPVFDGSAWIPPVESDDSGLSDSEDSDGDDGPGQVYEDESSDEDCAAPASPCATPGIKEIQWETVRQQNSAKDVPIWTGALPCASEIREPIQYFRDFFDNILLELIVQQSNLFYFQQRHCDLNLDQNELEQFLGTVVYMSVIQLPRPRLYWSRECRVAQVADIMNRNRWEEIKRSLHFNDNSNMAGNNDKLFKIRPLINSLRPKFNMLPQDQMLSIHEQILSFKGLVHSFDVYTGNTDPLPGEPDRGPGANIVLKLAQFIPSAANHLLYFDTCFSSLDLLVALANWGIPALGAVKQSHLPGCSFSSDSIMKKKGRGEFEEKKAVIESVEIRAVKWMNCRGLIVASTFASAQPVGKENIWDRKLMKHISIKCPSIISQYNTFKGGVDALGALISTCPIQLRSSKFYHKFFYYFLDMVIVNSWLLYQRDCDSLYIPKKMRKHFIAFRASIAHTLCLQGKDVSRKRSGQPSTDIEMEFKKKKHRGPAKAIPTQEVRSDSVGHWPEMESVRQRCKHPTCKGLTPNKCTKCNVHLCFNKRKNCFRDFHE
uniref:PiggyBac transposable element-derived protein domain-containing protein n=1 Tax=Neogobius melanostomus TaxID=47308 RepID=A0A8C6T630_9GOBI